MTIRSTRFSAPGNLRAQISSQRTTRRAGSFKNSCSKAIESLENRVLLSAGGALDSSFGVGGVVSGYTAYGAQNDGYLIAHRDGSNGPRLLAPDGTDAGPYFGAAPTTPAQNVQPDGKYLLVSNKVLTRYNPDGSVDRSFGNNGSVSDFTTGTSATSAIRSSTVGLRGRSLPTVAGSRPSSSRPPKRE